MEFFMRAWWKGKRTCWLLTSPPRMFYFKIGDGTEPNSSVTCMMLKAEDNDGPRVTMNFVGLDPTPAIGRD
ncbi:hypothetical protein TNCV_1280951 [Trichonephila clavipes]|nr:hypothetical protein TNCV_1280951 [Trichonephila clavipes]